MSNRKRKRVNDNDDAEESPAKNPKRKEDALAEAWRTIRHMDQRRLLWRTNVNKWQTLTEPCFKQNFEAFSVLVPHLVRSFSSNPELSSGVKTPTSAADLHLPVFAGTLAQFHVAICPPYECVFGRRYVAAMMVLLGLHAPGLPELVTGYYGPVDDYLVYVVTTSPPEATSPVGDDPIEKVYIMYEPSEPDLDALGTRYCALFRSMFRRAICLDRITGLDSHVASSDLA